MAGAIDMSFSTSACLELFRMDFADPSPELLPLGGPVPASERFHRVAWGTTGVDSGAHPYGIIAGGLVDGCVNLWSPKKVAEGGDGAKSALICPLRKHTGAVKGLEFNTFSPNLLASGAADGDLCIWDLANPSQPSLYPALKGTPAAPGQGVDVTHLSWNRKVQHILASTSSGGTTVVWDLKRQRQVISFTDPNMKRRCSALQWNPEVATQLVVASDDDRSPTLQVWDLRNSISPLREFSGHTKGVLSLAWCQADSSLMLSSGKDNRTICWDTDSGEPLCELPSSGNWNFDVQWSPTTPGLFSAASFDGRVGLYNLTDCTVGEKEKVVNPDFSVSYKAVGPATPLKKAPAWLKRPCGATFAFGGRLVSFGASKQPDGTEGPTAVRVQQVLDEQELPAMDDFDAAVAGDKAAIHGFCSVKAQQSASEEEEETWKFLQVLFEDDARRTLLQSLGFKAAEKPAAEKPAAEAAAEAVEGMALEGEPAPQNGLEGDGSDFFDSIPETPASPTPKQAAPPAAAPEDVAEALAEGEMDESEVALQACLVVGDYEGAVKECLKKNRMADALVLASMGGGDLWEATQKEYMRRAPQPYMRIVSAIVDNKLEGLIAGRPLEKWRETLALLCTYANSEEWTALCEKLAARLDAAGLRHPAVLAYICAGCTEQAVAIWSAELVDKQGSLLASIPGLQALIEKAVVLGVATSQKQNSDLYSTVMNTYAEFLASQGKMELALQYLSKLPGEATPDTAILKDRIYRAGGSLTAHMQAPPFPFEAVSTSGSSAAAAAPAVQPAAAGGAQSYANPYSQQQQQLLQQQQQANYNQTAYSQMPNAYHQQTYQPQAQAAAAGQSYQSDSQPAFQAAQTTSYQPSAASFPQAGYGAQPAQPVQQAQYTPSTQYQEQQNVQQFKPTAQYASSQPAVFQPSAAAAAAPAVQTVAQPAMFTPQAHSTGAASSYQSFQPTAPTAGAYAPMPQSSPAPQAPAEPAKPAKPTLPANCNLSNVDTANVAEDLKPVLACLSGFHANCAQAHPARKKELDDVSKKFGALFFKLNIDDIKPSVKESLIKLCAALNQGDVATSNSLITQLTASDWDECGPWLTAVKRR
eukprot:CAMPEP_0119125334 /NCGR_PEP_ID=MMETSP1310-20130426/4646_1 /TAXON_ID=464262 /ORGANISM="Genus nov. species nov., Strain RCC2339" /LENGTH=1095 /DNA_ID=CAMNT_0007115393 /DNA_START=21 /DNA_END=3304 /DNA_ORIENTATION=+